VIVPLAEGFEEIEAVAVIDILRRADIPVTVAGVGATEITGSHGIRIACDRRIEDCDAATVAAVVLPGGMPGSRNLGESAHLAALIGSAAGAGRLVAAICAAPTVLNRLGLLEGHRATSHPNHAGEMDRCQYVESPVVTDRNVITSRGAGTAVAFAAEVVAHLVDRDTAAAILVAIQVPE
jgi:4-methyl-5(b-hydroxyethyl)-thiazole monophosphate biosynthesis